MSKVKTQVMASVMVIYALRRVFSAYALKVYGLTAAVFAIFFTISVPHVVSNMMQVGLLNTGGFLVEAFKATTLTVQLMSVLAFVCMALLVRDSLRISARFN